MTKFVGLNQGKKSDSPNIKYVKQTNDMLLSADSNLELIALQIGKLSVREQYKFIRLILSYIDVVANSKNVVMKDAIELCSKIMEIVNLYYEENE
jgi:hypothetical protein